MSDFRENLRQIKLTGPLDIYQVGYLGRALEVSVGSFFLENNLFLFKSLALVDSSVGLSREWKRADLWINEQRRLRGSFGHAAAEIDLFFFFAMIILSILLTMIAHKQCCENSFNYSFDFSLSLSFSFLCFADQRKGKGTGVCWCCLRWSFFVLRHSVPPHPTLWGSSSSKCRYVAIRSFMSDWRGSSWRSNVDNSPLLHLSPSFLESSFFFSLLLETAVLLEKGLEAFLPLCGSIQAKESSHPMALKTGTVFFFTVASAVLTIGGTSLSFPSQSSLTTCRANLLSKFSRTDSTSPLRPSEMPPRKPRKKRSSTTCWRTSSGRMTSPTPLRRAWITDATLIPSMTEPSRRPKAWSTSSKASTKADITAWWRKTSKPLLKVSIKSHASSEIPLFWMMTPNWHCTSILITTTISFWASN